MVTTRRKPFMRNDLQPSPITPEPSSRAMRSPGRPRTDNRRIQSPTIGDIREIAGFYEGEGHFNKSVIINQNDKEKLDWIQIRFGGKVYGPYIGSAGNDYYSWILTRERALGFMFTIFTFLSKSRRKQFRDVLEGKGSKRRYQATISNEGISEAWLNKMLNKHKAKQDNKRKGAMGLFGVKNG